MRKTLWWKCLNCGGVVDVKKQLVGAPGLFDAKIGEAIWEPEDYNETNIVCPNCGASWNVIICGIPL